MEILEPVYQILLLYENYIFIYIPDTVTYRDGIHFFKPYTCYTNFYSTHHYAMSPLTDPALHAFDHEPSFSLNNITSDRYSRLREFIVVKLILFCKFFLLD